jgi:hypothetical protein
MLTDPFASGPAVTAAVIAGFMGIGTFFGAWRRWILVAAAGDKRLV